MCVNFIVNSLIHTNIDQTLQFIKTAIRFTPMLVYLLMFYCRCTLPGNVIFFIAHSLFNCHSSFCYHSVNSLHILLNCEIGGLEYHVITTKDKTGVHCLRV